MSQKKLFSARVGKQISVYLENRPGTLSGVIDLLRAEGINMLALSLAEGLEVGYLRIIVDDHVRGVKALRKHGQFVLEKDVILLEVSNEPGGMASAIDRWAKAGVNVEYAYSATVPGADVSLIVARVNDIASAMKSLSL